MLSVTEAWQELPTPDKVKVTEPKAISVADGEYTIPFNKVGLAIVPALPLEDQVTLAVLIAVAVVEV